MFYCGFIGEKNHHFAIVTKFIEGEHPTTWANKSDALLCRKSLGKINKLGIQHCDARLPNFVIVTEKKDNSEYYKKHAVIIDFGFSSLFFKPIHESLMIDKTLNKSTNSLSVS